MGAPSSSAVDQLVARLLPDSYKALLTLMEDLGVVSFDGDVEYDMCSGCYRIFRCEWRHCKECPRCSRSRSACLKVVWRGLAQYATQVYAVPELARDLGSWQQRREARRQRDPGLISDVTDGLAWARIVDGDARFAAEARNLAVLIAFDPFQVRA